MGSLDQLSERERTQVLAASSPLVWGVLKLGLERTTVHSEWHRLLLEHGRLCLLAPRAHGKSTTVATHVAWRLWREPGLTAHVFSATDALASKLKRRIDAALGEGAPSMMPRRPPSDSSTSYTNASSLEASGVGVTTRGLHPDLIVADDLLSEEHASSSGARRRLHDWFHGSMLGMPHGGVTRTVHGKRTRFAPTTVALVGTPMHFSDLIVSMKHNPIWQWYRFASEYDTDRLPLPGESLAVEIGGSAEPVPRTPIDHKARAMASMGERPNTEATYGPDRPHPFGTRRDTDPEGKLQPQKRTRSELRWRL